MIFQDFPMILPFLRGDSSIAEEHMAHGMKFRGSAAG
jgi:hypothetical protein